VEQPLPISGRRGLLRKAGDSAVAAARLDAQHQLRQFQAQVRTAFFETLLFQEMDALFADGVARLENVVRVLREREREGEGSGFDRMRAERELAIMRADWIETRTSLAGTRARLASFLPEGTDPAGLTVSGDFGLVPLSPLEVVLTSSLISRADYLATKERLSQHDKSRRAARRRRIPELVVTGGWKQVEDVNYTDDGYVVALQLPIPLFNRGQVPEAMALASLAGTELQEGALRREIQAEVRGAYTAARLGRELAEEFGRLMDTTAHDLRRVAEIAYEDGEQGILELLDAYRIEMETQRRRLELQNTAKAAEVELDRAMGKEVTP